MSELCGIAVATITTALVDGVRCIPRVEDLSGRLAAPAATFVTLERNSRLLGCVGTLDARLPLAIDVAEHALAAAFDDPRVPAVTHDDLAEMSVKVSVLSASSPIPARSFDESRAVVRPGVDGVTVEHGRAHRATLLPSVWEKVADVDEFLDALWLKAGLRPRTWPPGIRVSRYTTTEEYDAGPR